MKCKSLVFDRPRHLAVQEGEIPEPGGNQLLVATRFSAISAGTELLVYQGRFPENMAVDSLLPDYGGQFEYPLQYGYCAVGEVTAAGDGVDENWLGRKVFGFKPHASHFLARPEELHSLPEGVEEREAVFLAGMETAVNIVQDAAPLLGERVLVIGQGIIGLLTSHLLARFPLAALVAVDKHSLRRKASLEAGAQVCLDPDDADFVSELDRLLQNGSLPGKADLAIELTGNPAALNTALDRVGFAGRIIVGSWYGTKETSINLGGEFHRKRIQLVSSQVSSISPELSGRWDKERRLTLAWSELQRAGPGKLISHEFAIDEAEQAFDLLDNHPEQALQVVFRYA